MEFEWHKRNKGRWPCYNDPRLSIRKDGMISVNEAFLKTYILQPDGGHKYTYVQLGYNKPENVIGIRLQTEKQQGSKKIQTTANSRGGTISGIGFIRQFEVPHPKENIKAQWDELEKIIIVKL
tara:strand:+ start:1432 stop:1800 length:369 start_codon:yes stop_codon:yes gene_type:complete